MWTLRSARAGMDIVMLLGALAGCSSMNAYSNRQLPPVAPGAGPAEPGDGGLQPIWAHNRRCSNERGRGDPTSSR
jgi:hypothetical protein